MSNMRLVSKGKTHTITTLAQLGRIAVGNASAHPTELANWGWTAAHTELLENDVAKMMESEAAKAEAKATSKNYTTAEFSARQEAKSTIRRVREAVKILTRDEAVEGVSLENLTMGDNMNTTPGILMYIERTAPLVARLDTHLERFFQGQKASEMLTQAAAMLAEADTAQETSRLSLPSDTMAVNELKGKILDQVEELNSIAKMAFDGQADLRAKFNKDLLLRGIQKKVTTPVTPTDPQ